jgi:hypothetical protein
VSTGLDKYQETIWNFRGREKTLIKKANILRFIKPQSPQWAANVIRMDPLRTVKKLTELETCSSRSIRKPRLRWINQVQKDV